jgi:hypothetical protein
VAFWRSGLDGRASNGGKHKDPVAIGLREKIDGPLKICTRMALHGTLDPTKWKGDRLWVVALYGEIQRQDDKLGALEREIIAEWKWDIK